MKMLCRPFWARLSLWVLFYLSIMAPLHLAEEVHVLLPASAEHHAQLHCEDQHQPHCANPHDDVSQPLSSEQHQQHHQASCAGDEAFFFVEAIHDLKTAPTKWHLVLLDFVPVEPPHLLAVPAAPTRSRAPPDSHSLPPSPHYAFRSGLSPPVLI